MEFVARILVQCQWSDTRYVQASPSAAWLYRCAVNHTIDFKRTRIRLHVHECFSLDTFHESIRLVQESGCPCQMHLMQSWHHDQVIAAISCLSSRQQYVFVAYHVNDVPIRDIALALHVSPHAVEQCLFRARQRLRELLTRQGVSPWDL
jgi:RNA polymerase sigma factor (sigma-70 family)